MDDVSKISADDSKLDWSRISSHLVAEREQRLQDWGNLDDVTLARYLGGQATREESERVRLAMDAHAMVKECMGILRQVNKENLIANTQRAEEQVSRRRPRFSRADRLEKRFLRWRKQRAIVAADARAIAVAMIVLFRP